MLTICTVNIFLTKQIFLMKNRMLLSFLILVLGLCSVQAQRIGINTTNPGDAGLTITPPNGQGRNLILRDANDVDRFEMRTDGNSWALANAQNGANFLDFVIQGPGYTRIFGNTTMGSPIVDPEARLSLTPPTVNGKNLIFRDFNDDARFEIRTDANSWALANAQNGSNFIAAVVGQGVIVQTDLNVTGAKNFIIDHPLEPATKSLRHACVEGPEAYNVYSGTITLDGQGKASVILPDYFEALNKDYRYQLTAIGAAAPSLHVAKEVTGNQFAIAGGTPGMKVSWEVTGVRNDPYFQDHPYQAVQPKSANDQGRYYYPKGYGQPESMSIGAAPQKTDQ